MGVHSYWEIVGPTARPVRLESLQDRRMAIDASIWIYQFLKAIRDPEGNALKNSHILGFFRRICKLLYFGIKPVFVFDGGVPLLKRNTIKARKEIRQGKRDSAKRTARKLLALQLHKGREYIKKGSQNSTSTISFRPEDDWDLPEIEGFLYSVKDQRINPDYEKERKQKLLSSSKIEEAIDDLDLESINPTSKEFTELPKAVQYQILAQLRLKSRLRMGYSKEQLQQVFPNSMDFSKFQIDMVKRRNFYTQKLINVTGIHDGGASKLDDEIIDRISGQRQREYKLTKTDNGWILGLGDNDGSEIKKAIIVDNKDVNDKNIKAASDKDEEDDFGWEEVDLKPKKSTKDTFDYSLKAGRLPQFEKSIDYSGSQAFLDSRPNEGSPVKRARGESTLIKPIRVTDSYQFEDNNKDDDYDDEDDYLEHINELELMEAVKKSQLEAAALKGNIDKDNNVATVDEKAKIDSNKEGGENIVRTPMNLSVDTSSNANGFPLTEGQQNLNYIVGKLPDLHAKDSQSFLFNNVQDEKETRSGTSHKPVPELPAWFQSNEQDSTLFSKSNFVADRGEERDSFPKENLSDNKETEPTYALLTGINAQYLLDEQKKELGSTGTKEETDDLIETFPPVEKEITELAKKDNEDSVDEMKIDAQVTQDKPLIFDYDFPEDEEQGLIEDIRREEEDFRKFKANELNKASIESNMEHNIADTAFMEDELFEQQTKDKRDSDEVTMDMITDVQELLSRFGIPFVTAPMEAEAQCAELIALGLVDGIITDDSDVFLFGGTKVYKNLFQDKKYVEFYNYDTIEKSLGIDRKKMIELALLLGSDYTTGIKGMGPVSSMEILAEFDDLKNFKEWYNEGQFDKKKLESQNKFQKDLRKRLVNNEVTLDDTFPSELVFDAYLHPEVDHDSTPFVWGDPDLDMLRTFMKIRLNWPQEKSDEALVPLIREINGRKNQKRQKTLNEFFPSEYIQENRKLNLGKRITTAADKLKRRRLK
ncbi:hypothetical protein KAFR_0B04510 [Kazachstania africana CBS 2517]|uniref:DNA repair protein RAD2 n=1 Tax=Kazachstania africana (strain ATCC 22294 / BCRC 22015 / CBS 2517 / CECT 1963 / NBRC 1671 / NRRL Y-8276) TaxID=1071382 RepID=H2AQU8_KAZAF|nr:hypothetical protein KAFR_0B04510 [Kazachstania africana CBS 2517]CCF56748.1 hypothetical protein KAFR_0B04510 [Kazachstania africana CBS 2517]